MFLHLLSDADKSHFLDVAYLFCIADAPMRWDGKSEDEITGETDLSQVSIRVPKGKSEGFAEFAKECGEARAAGKRRTFSSDDTVGFELEYSLDAISERDHVGESVLARLKPLPITRQNNPGERHKAAVEALDELFEDKVVAPTAAKVMLYELLVVARSGDALSEVDDALLQHLAGLLDVEDFIFEDLKARAECTTREVVKTLSLILE